MSSLQWDLDWYQAEELFSNDVEGDPAGEKFEEGLKCDGGNPDCLVAAGETECMGDFKKLIVERSVTVSCWRTPALSSNFEMPLFLLSRLVSR